MDLSAIIFVVLALAWAVYLIPKALKHHDDLASDRLVEGHSDKVRILSRRSSAGTPEVVEVEVEHTDTVEKTTTVPPVATPVARPLVTRAAARHAMVTIVYDRPRVRVLVADDGIAKVPDARRGHGIEGMRERAALHGGTLRAGPRPDSAEGWVVEATLGRP